MKNISNIKADVAESDEIAVPLNAIANTQSNNKTTRRIRAWKSGFKFESDNGASAFVPTSELWLFMESIDARFKIQ